MKKITAVELQKWRTDHIDHQLVDIREDYEVSYSNIGGEHIPMSEIIDQVSRLRKDVPVIIHCRTGKRAAAVITALERKFNLSNLYTLEGGIVAWAESVDSTLLVY